MNLMRTKLFLISIIAILFSFIGFWGFYSLYVRPIINHLNVIIADPTYILSVLFGTSFVFFGFIFSFVILFICKSIKKNKNINESNNTKFFYFYLIFSLVCGGGVAFISNVILLHKIIPEDGYVLCPKKIGYKKNLLRDYVLDIEQCERF